jgi:hypothetical protein
MLIVLTLEFDTRDCIEVRIAAGGGIRIHFARSLRRQQRSFAGPRLQGQGLDLKLRGRASRTFDVVMTLGVHRSYVFVLLDCPARPLLRTLVNGDTRFVNP